MAEAIREIYIDLTGQIFDLDSAVVKTQKYVCIAWRLSNPCNASTQGNKSNYIDHTVIKQFVLANSTYLHCLTKYLFTGTQNERD